MKTQQLKLYASLKAKAKRAFLSRDYLQALELLSYAHSLSLDATQHPKDTTNQATSKKSLELATLCTLADMAIEHEDEARALFDYYQVTIKKNKNKGNLKSAEENILEVVENFDQNLSMLHLAINHLEHVEADKYDGILYKDFQNLEREIGFKEAFIDLMFSTKIIFTSKNEFLFFMHNLVEHGFKEVAMHYFEDIGNLLYYDKDFTKLYEKILQNP